MKISTRTRYGVRAMADLAMHYKGKPILVREIAKRQEVSDKYLEHIMLALKKAGLVVSMSGAKGGYLLMKDPADVTILDIVQVLEGSLAPVPCIDHKDICARSSSCKVMCLWSQVKEAINKVLGSVTLKDLASGDGDEGELFNQI